MFLCSKKYFYTYAFCLRIK